MVAKGTQAIRITKVKGHTTGTMVTAGQVRPQDKEGNDQADAAADQAVQQHGLAIQQYGQRLADRHRAYVTIVAAIQAHLEPEQA